METTLRPLNRHESSGLDPTSNDELLRVALERFKQTAEYESAERSHQLEALRFRAGDHSIASMRGAGGEAYPAPTMTVDRQSAFLKQVVNSYRRAPLSIRVRPKSGGATKQIADVLEGKIREIEQESEAEQAYAVALDQAAGQGTGYIRLITEWVDDYSFEQTLRILPVYSRFSVYVDPASTHPAGLDMNFCFIVEKITRDTFMAKYRLQPPSSSQWQGTGDDMWYDGDFVQISDYYYRTWEEVELVQFPNGTVIPAKDIGEVDPTWPKRTAQIPTIYCAKLCGSAVLSKSRWLGRYCPLILVEGTRLDVDGKTMRTGIIQQTLTSQLAVDYAFCHEMEALALAPKAPYIAAAEQIAEYKDYWDRANDPYRPYLPYKPIAGIPPPQRQSVEPAIQALTLARQQAADDMRAVLGMYAPSMGEPGQERSGTAIRSQKLEGDQSTFHFPANLAWSIRAVGLQIVDILPRLYSRPTTLRQIGKDGAVSMTPVNQMDAPSADEQMLLSKGNYDVAVDSGPAYSTQREMAAERLGELGRVLPEALLPLVADLWVAQLDIPYAEELSARLKTVVPPEALDATKDKNPQTAIAALQNQIQQATQALQAMQQQLQQSQQTEQVATQQVKLLEQQVATMQARMADKHAENQIDVQKSQWQYEVDKEKNQLAMLELQLKYSQQAQMPTANGVPEPAEESD
jgi:hypothetical protein